ncbi:hypothetical protein MVEN_00475000 [Mycena venus]|uniref:Calponin-homology (CH) domain-containing protein n=1 Tax=Mycena venus TaxID=2733690 RepID=A0A8H6YX92_9AGAR|nr:hypothetical protein MVEN_00475000 [Mycena venus]
MASASSTELLAWLNDLLQLNYTKVDECGRGGAYLQVLDSIYGDIPMARVKMNAKGESEYLANYTIMETVFKDKNIDKVIPVDKLVRCEMQDNLVFLQWLRSLWDANYAVGEYDAVSRRMGALTLQDPSASESPAPIAAQPSPPSSVPTPCFDTLDEEVEFYNKKHRAALDAGGRDDDSLRKLQTLILRPQSFLPVDSLQSRIIKRPPVPITLPLLPVLHSTSLTLPSLRINLSAHSSFLSFSPSESLPPSSFLPFCPFATASPVSGDGAGGARATRMLARYTLWCTLYTALLGGYAMSTVQDVLRRPPLFFAHLAVRRFVLVSLLARFTPNSTLLRWNSFISSVFHLRRSAHRRCLDHF